MIAGVDPAVEGSEETVEDLCNTFMESRQARMEAGELGRRSLDDYHNTVKRLAKFLGKKRMLKTLGPKDFSALKKKYCESWGAVTVKNEINRVKVILKYAVDMELVDRAINTGPDFRRPSTKALRLHRKSKPKKFLEAEEIHAVLGVADVHFRAMILLGINAAYNNKDCGLLERSWIDFDRQWLSRHRNKTAVDREAYLWPETTDALLTSLSKRKEPKSEEHRDLVFITKFGSSWSKESNDNPVSKRMRILLDKVGVRRDGVNFGSLRHTFQTIAGDSRDQVAVTAPRRVGSECFTEVGNESENGS